MSNITQKDWSHSVLKVLRETEETCSDDDLFCVGYLIPLVELVEVERADEQVPKTQWHDWLVEFVGLCLEEEKISEQDKQRVREMTAGLA